MSRESMPEITRVDYVVTYEWINSEENWVEYSDAQYAAFLTRYEEELQKVFPNAELNIFLDGAQYTTRQDQIFTADSDDETADSFRDLEDWALYVCGEVASEVAADTLPAPDDETGVEEN